MLFIFHFICDFAIPMVQYCEDNGMNKDGNTCKLIPSAIKLLFSKCVELFKSYPRNTKFITSKIKLRISRTDMRARVCVCVCVGVCVCGYFCKPYTMGKSPIIILSCYPKPSSEIIGKSNVYESFSPSATPSFVYF
jgi:hypothetical protein